MGMRRPGRGAFARPDVHDVATAPAPDTPTDPGPAMPAATDIAEAIAATALGAIEVGDLSALPTEVGDALVTWFVPGAAAAAVASATPDAAAAAGRSLVPFRRPAGLVPSLAGVARPE